MFLISFIWAFYITYNVKEESGANALVKYCNMVGFFMKIFAMAVIILIDLNGISNFPIFLNVTNFLLWGQNNWTKIYKSNL